MNDFDLIDRKEALEVKPERLNSSVERITEKWTLADRSYARGWNACIAAWARRIEELPAVHPQQKKGKWVSIFDEEESKCSECGKAYYYPEERRYYFCPNCGADMRGE